MKKKGYTYFSGFIMLCICLLLVLGVSAPVQADEMWNWTWTDMETKTGDYTTQSNGWVTLTVENSTSFVWGDMHFEVWSCGWMGCGDITNIDFVDNSPSGSPLSPDTDRSPYSWVIDNGTVGATLDYYYYFDPIGVGETGMFKFKLNNPDGNLYTLAVTPSVVPEPVSSSLFIVGAASLGARRFWKKRKSA